MNLLANLFRPAPPVEDEADGQGEWLPDPEVATMYPEPDTTPDIAPPDVAVVTPRVTERVRLRKGSAWATWRVALEANIPRRIVGCHLGRTSLLVRNISAAGDADLGPGENVTPGTGWPVAAGGGQLTLDNTGAVWAVTAGAAVSLVVLAEYDVDTGGA